MSTFIIITSFCVFVQFALVVCVFMCFECALSLHAMHSSHAQRERNQYCAQPTTTYISQAAETKTITTHAATEAHTASSSNIYKLSYVIDRFLRWWQCVDSFRMRNGRQRGNCRLVRSSMFHQPNMLFWRNNIISIVGRQKPRHRCEVWMISSTVSDPLRSTKVDNTNTQNGMWTK